MDHPHPFHIEECAVKFAASHPLYMAVPPNSIKRHVLEHSGAKHEAVYFCFHCRVGQISTKKGEWKCGACLSVTGRYCKRSVRTRTHAREGRDGDVAQHRVGTPCIGGPQRFVWAISGPL